MKAFEWAHSYGYYLHDAEVMSMQEIQERHLREELCGSLLVGLGKSIKLADLKWSDPFVEDIIGYERPDGSINPRKFYSFLGCDNQAVEVTQEEWDELIRRNNVYKAEREARERQKRIEDLRYLIAKAERQTSIPTPAEAKKMRERWNNLHNEGGEGFVPWIVDNVAYNSAKAELKQLEGV